MTTNPKSEAEQLKKAVNELMVLNKIAGSINVLMAVEDITRSIVENCLEHIGATQGAIYLLSEVNHKANTFIRVISTSSDQIQFTINEDLAGWMLINKRMFVCNDAECDEHFKRLKLLNHGIKTILAAPLFAKGRVIGTIILVNKKDPDGFSKDDERFLGIVSAQTANVIENAHLREQEAELLDVKEELKLARITQKKFLPDKGLDFNEGSIMGVNYPANEVGGDYFDFYELDNNNIFLSLGDVAGKGMPAALLMATAQTILRYQLTGVVKIDLTHIADRFNSFIHQFTKSESIELEGFEHFITTIFGVYDISSRLFSYVNAGHPPPLVVKRNGRIDEMPLMDRNMVIGFLPGIEYNVHAIQLNPGEILVVYTDGIDEAFNEAGSQFGKERLTAYLEESRAADIDDFCSGLYQEVKDFMGNADQSDDMTYLVMKLK